MGFPARIEFDAQPICDDDTIQRNIASSLARKLPEALKTPTTLRIIANGPSALTAPLDGLTLALNGALGMMLKRGVEPTFWACCDPQAMVADFLTEAPLSTTYYVASKCHPAVFDRLKRHKVFIWHVDDVDLPQGKRGVRHTSTITATAANLFHRMGWQSFEFWGWDGCFMDGRHHANETHSPVASQITATINERSFETTYAWACEAEEAGYILQIADYDWTIKGDGLIRAYIEALDIKPIGRVGLN